MLPRRMTSYIDGIGPANSRESIYPSYKAQENFFIFETWLRGQILKQSLNAFVIFSLLMQNFRGF